MDGDAAPDEASPEGLGARTEMICVYSLGPLGTACGAGASSPDGRENAPVAPSEDMADAAGGFGVGVGLGKTGAGGATYGPGIGGANGSFGRTGADGTGAEKTGAGKAGAGGPGAEKFGTSGLGAGKADAASTAARGRPADGGVLVLEVRERVSALNHPVNEPVGSFPAMPGAGSGCSGWGFAEPNTEVKSPTAFGGASCRGVTLGISDGASPRNGP
jgi:hypothetical protein